MTLTEWAKKWNIPDRAILDLQRSSYLTDPYRKTDPSPRETDIQNRVRLEASRKGIRLWRNNRGAMLDGKGHMVRYGLANDSRAVDDKIKSSDLIGIRPVKIDPSMVGVTIGQFVSREIKKADWHYTGTHRETAQLAWLELVLALGGDAAFATGEGTL